jgi:hypothetical protein
LVADLADTTTQTVLKEDAEAVALIVETLLQLLEALQLKHQTMVEQVTVFVEETWLVAEEPTLEQAVAVLVEREQMQHLVE